jgi:hypothetical protein
MTNAARSGIYSLGGVGISWPVLKSRQLLSLPYASDRKTKSPAISPA